MKPTTLTPDDLFRPQRRYIIPLFQRGYVWNEAEQWAPLWRDMVVQARKVETADEAGSHAGTLRRHFLGAIVLEPKPTWVRHVADHAVVDGQQRLTTLQIILVAFRDVVATSADADLLRDLNLLTFNEGQWPSEEEQFKLWPTNVGRAAWRQLVAARSDVEVKAKFPPQKQKVKRKNTWVRQPLAQAYLYFYSQITAYLKGGPGISAADEEDEWSAATGEQSLGQPDAALDLNRAKYLLEALTKYFQIVAIELEATDDPQVIFETLNARMAPLTPADLIRNFVFIAATRKNIDTEQLYEDTWAVFDRDPGTAPDVPGFWRGSQKQGRRFHSRLDLFFFHYLTMRTGREISLGGLFQAFRAWWEGGDDDAVGGARAPAHDTRDPRPELTRMVKASQAMRALLDPGPSQTDPVARLARRLQILDTTTPFPILLYLAENRTAMGDEEYVGSLVDLESYLVRRALCDLTPKNYNQIFPRALAALRAEPVPTRAGFQHYLLGLEGEASRWPTDGEVRNGVLLTPAYTRLGPARTQMVLQVLEKAHNTGREEGIVIPWATVEHAMPQTPASLQDWPYPDDTSSPSLEQQQLRWTVRESLGNLTLVTHQLNSSLSNGPFLIKKAKLAEESQLRMNRYFANFPRDRWNETDIVERGKVLAEKVIQLWPRPVQ